MDWVPAALVLPTLAARRVEGGGSEWIFVILEVYLTTLIGKILFLRDFFWQDRTHRHIHLWTNRLFYGKIIFNSEISGFFSNSSENITKKHCSHYLHFLSCFQAIICFCDCKLKFHEPNSYHLISGMVLLVFICFHGLIRKLSYNI